MNVIDVGIAAQQRREFRVDHPGNFRVRMRVGDEGDGRQSMDDVAERAGFDDENRFHFTTKDTKSTKLTRRRKPGESQFPLLVTRHLSLITISKAGAARRAAAADRR